MNTLKELYDAYGPGTRIVSCHEIMWTMQGRANNLSIILENDEGSVYRFEPNNSSWKLYVEPKKVKLYKFLATESNGLYFELFNYYPNIEIARENYKAGVIIKRLDDTMIEVEE